MKKSTFLGMVVLVLVLLAPLFLALRARGDSLPSRNPAPAASNDVVVDFRLVAPWPDGGSAMVWNDSATDTEVPYTLSLRNGIKLQCATHSRFSNNNTSGYYILTRPDAGLTFVGGPDPAIGGGPFFNNDYFKCRIASAAPKWEQIRGQQWLWDFGGVDATNNTVRVLVGGGCAYGDVAVNVRSDDSRLATSWGDGWGNNTADTIDSGYRIIGVDLPDGAGQSGRVVQELGYGPNWAVYPIGERGPVNGTFTACDQTMATDGSDGKSVFSFYPIGPSGGTMQSITVRAMRLRLR